MLSNSRPRFSQNASSSQPFSTPTNPAVQVNSVLPGLPALPALPVLTRTMQITLPENATHIVICTASNERKEIQLPRFTPINPTKPQQHQVQQVPKKKPHITGQNPDDPPKIVANKKTSSKLEHSCSECGKKYSTSSNLARHKQTHR